MLLPARSFTVVHCFCGSTTSSNASSASSSALISLAASVDGTLAVLPPSDASASDLPLWLSLSGFGCWLSTSGPRTAASSRELLDAGTIEPLQPPAAIPRAQEFGLLSSRRPPHSSDPGLLGQRYACQQVRTQHFTRRPGGSQHGQIHDFNRSICKWTSGLRSLIASTARKSRTTMTTRTIKSTTTTGTTLCRCVQHSRTYFILSCREEPPLSITQAGTEQKKQKGRQCVRCNSNAT